MAPVIGAVALNPALISSASSCDGHCTTSHHLSSTRMRSVRPTASAMADFANGNTNAISAYVAPAGNTRCEREALYAGGSDACSRQPAAAATTWSPPPTLPKVVQEQEQVLIRRQGWRSLAVCKPPLDALPDPLTDLAEAAAVQPEHFLELHWVLQDMLPLVLKVLAVPLQELGVPCVLEAHRHCVEFIIRTVGLVVGRAGNGFRVVWSRQTLLHVLARCGQCMDNNQIFQLGIVKVKLLYVHGSRIMHTQPCQNEVGAFHVEIAIRAHAGDDWAFSRSKD